MDDRTATTALINAFAHGDDKVEEELFERIHGSLEALAHGVARAGRDPFMETGDLIGEAYLKLIDQHKADWNSRLHYLRFAARAMRRIKIDSLRRQRAIKRGPENKAEYDDASTGAEDLMAQHIELDDILNELERLDARQAQVVEMRVYGRFTVPEIAEAIGFCEKTVKNDWATASAWLKLKMK